MPHNLMRKSVTVSRQTVTKGPVGGPNRTYATLYESVPADLQPATATSATYYYQNNIAITHLLFTTQALVLQTGDIVEYDSRTFYITGFRNLIELGRVYEIALEEYVGTAPKGEA